MRCTSPTGAFRRDGCPRRPSYKPTTPCASYRARHRRRLRGSIPRMSAACSQLSAPLNARMMTSWTFIARSTAAAAKTMVTPLADHGYSLDRAKSGHFTCSRERTDHLLPTLRGCRFDVFDEALYRAHHAGHVELRHVEGEVV